MAAESIRIGSCSAFWGDTQEAARQLLGQGRLDYLVGDYLAEITMSLLARAKEKDAAAGYVPDFISAIAPLLPQIAASGVKVVVNAGGINPEGCRAALQRAAAPADLDLRMAVVEGDDLLPQTDTIRAAAPAEMFTGASFPAKPLSINAYLGARPIAAALDAGAQIVITGRCVDSALVPGPLLHEFGWADDDYDLLSAGSLVGHLIECGAQCTGGLFTDWESVPGWDDMGFPIAECAADGSAVITKPAASGGLVTPATVGEQLLYEIGDPGAYLLPDVSCDWTQVQLQEVGPQRVRVSGARGRVPPASYKVCATYADGYRALATLLLAGFDATLKTRRQGEGNVRVPKLSVCVHASNGAGHYAMTSAAWDPRFIFTWPNARVSVMGAEQAAKTLTQIKAAALRREGRPASEEEMAAIEQHIFAEYEGSSDCYYGTSEMWDDGVLDPVDTRNALGVALGVALNHLPDGGRRGVLRI